MSENTTLESIVDEGEEYLYSEDYYEFAAHNNNMHYIRLYYYPILIISGVSCSLLVLTILFGRRLWIRHEAYIYLAAILIVNIYELIFCYVDFWLNVINLRLLRLSLAAVVLCKCWVWLVIMSHYVDWLYVLLLLNVFLRLQQPTTSSDRRGCWANLAAKYCSLFGAKVIISSYFIVSALSSFVFFAMSRLEYHNESWYCFTSDGYNTQMFLLWWLEVDIPLFVEAVLLLLIVWKRKCSSGIVFRQIAGALQDNGDEEGVTRLVVCCAIAAFITRVPDLPVHFLHTSIYGLDYKINWKVLTIVFDALYLIRLAYPLSTPIVCLAAKSIFRDELKTMVQRCRCLCLGLPGSRCNRTLPAEPDNNASSVIQMDPIDEDSAVTRREEDSVPT